MTTVLVVSFYIAPSHFFHVDRFLKSVTVNAFLNIFLSTVSTSTPVMCHLK